MIEFSEIWDRIADEFEYLISFEWIGDIGEFFSGLFDGLTEISIFGLICGLIAVYLTHITMGKLDFITMKNGVGQIVWRVIMYVFAFFLTYIMTKRVRDMA